MQYEFCNTFCKEDLVNLYYGRNKKKIVFEMKINRKYVYKSIYFTLNAKSKPVYIYEVKVIGLSLLLLVFGIIITTKF